MNPGILTSGYQPPPLPYSLLGRPTPVPMPGNYLHPETQDWASRVRNAGGSVSGTTLLAVDRFCRDIDTAGIRDRFYRLNLMCGDFTAALVPLYRNTTLSGSVLGNTTDTNNNFVSGDYSETGFSTGGLKGNGSTKYLDTGVNPVSISASVSNFHLSIYASGVSGTGTSRGYIGNSLGQPGLAPAQETYIGITSTGTTESAGIAGSGAAGSSTRVAAPSGTKEGMLLITTNGSRTQTYYLNGATSSRTADSSFASASIDVFRASNLYALAQYIRTYSVGLGLSAAQEASFRNAVVAFNATLRRNV